MAQFLYHYKGKEERQARIVEAEGKRQTMIYDTFDNPNWQPSDEQAGVLTYTDTPKEPTIIPAPIDYAKQYSEALTIEAKLDVLARKVRIK